MEGHIRHLHCRFRVLAGRNAAAEVTRLEHAARQYLAESFETALEQALGDDPAVYVLRSVDYRQSFVGGTATPDSEITRQWGEGLARAVVTRLATEPNGDRATAWVRFDDQADYVAHFVEDLLAGRAWERWFYGAFASLRPLDQPAALRRVLEDHLTVLPDILRDLHRDRKLDALLVALNGDDRRWLWSRLRGARNEELPQAARGLFTAALRLVDRLEGWSRPSPGPDILFASYLATGPTPADWRDRTSLAAAVLDAIRFLSAQGFLKENLSDGQSRKEALDQALAEFDWLDTDWLKAGLFDLQGKETAHLSMPGTDLPLPFRSRSLTPRMRGLFVALTAALGQRERGLNRSFPGSPDNALRLYTWLISDNPIWAGDPSAPALIDRLLVAWGWVNQAGELPDILRALAGGNLTAALNRLPATSRASAAESLEFLAGLGREGLAVIEAMAGSSSASSGEPTYGFLSESLVIDLNCAGVTLLLRAILDVHLPGISQRVGYPPELSNLLAALYLAWAGPLGVRDGHVEPGLSYLAGFENPPRLEDLRDSWSTGELLDFETAWLDALAGQRMLSGAELHLYRLPLTGEGAWALVAGAETGMLWPVGRAVQSFEEASTVLAAWHTGWTDAAGFDPVVIADDELDGLLSYQPIILLSMADEAMSARHRLGGAHLRAAWDTLGTPFPALVPSYLLAFGLLRLWARWLRQFSESSVPYLLQQFIRRPGRLYPGKERVWIELEPRPLDIVAELAGYMAPLEGVPWLDGRTVYFGMAGR